MRSIKPGRGPALMGTAGSVFSLIFGICWLWLTLSIIGDSNAPLPVKIIFPLAGVFVIVMSIVGFFYSLHNATGKNRFSEFDITSPGEESDPLDAYIGQSNTNLSKYSNDSDDETVEEKLQELESLRDKNLVTADEYALQRKRILDQI